MLNPPPDWDADWAAFEEQGEEIRDVLLGVIHRLRDGPPYTDDDPPPDIEGDWYYLSPTQQELVRQVLAGE